MKNQITYYLIFCLYFIHLLPSFLCIIPFKADPLQTLPKGMVSYHQNQIKQKQQIMSQRLIKASLKATQRIARNYANIPKVNKQATSKISPKNIEKIKAQIFKEAQAFVNKRMSQNFGIKK